MFDKLPDDIVLTIFCFLDPKHLYNLILTNHNIKKLAEHDFVWKFHCFNFQVTSKSHSTWKDEFKHSCIHWKHGYCLHLPLRDDTLEPQGIYVKGKLTVSFIVKHCK